MRVLVIKYRKEFRKVILSKFTSMREKNEKMQNMYSSWQSSQGVFYQHKSLHLRSDSTVDLTVIVQVFASKCSIYFKE